MARSSSGLMTPWPPCCRTWGVDHGGADVRVSQQGLDGANVRTPLQKMSGKAVPERMRTDPLADSRLTDGLGNGLVDGTGGPGGGGEFGRSAGRWTDDRRGRRITISNPCRRAGTCGPGRGGDTPVHSPPPDPVHGPPSRVQGVLSGAVQASRGTS